MGEGLFKGVLHAGKEWEWWQLGAPATWSTSGSLERWMHRLANKSTSEPMVSCASLVAIKKALQPQPWVNSVVAVPALIPGPHLGAHESRTVSRTDWSCELFPNGASWKT
jgi:hypothetical protein